MEKQSLIKYYCALFIFLVLVAGFSNVANGQNTPSLSKTPTVLSSPPTLPIREQNINSSNNMWFPIILSILALIASGGAIALSILKNRNVNHSLDSLDKKYNSKFESLEKKYTALLEAQNNTSSHQQRETISRISPVSTNNPYLESSIESLSERISAIEGKLKVSHISDRSTSSFRNKSYNPPTYSEVDNNPFQQTEVIQPPENLAYLELVNTYNNNPRLLEQKATKVSEAKHSINRRHTDSSQQIVLEQANNPNYWVIHDDEGRDYWLLPKSKLRIDRFRYETTKALFECQGYDPEYSTFKLVKPAKVIPLSADEQTWQLEEPGILEFILDS